MNRKEILAAYAVPIVLMALVGPIAWSIGDGPVDIARKIWIVPLFLLAMRGLRTFFPEAKDGIRGWKTQLEFQVLTCGLAAICVVLVATPANDEVLWRMAANALGMTIVITGVNMSFFLHDRRKRARP